MVLVFFAPELLCQKWHSPSWQEVLCPRQECLGLGMPNSGIPSVPLTLFLFISFHLFPFSHLPVLLPCLNLHLNLSSVPFSRFERSENPVSAREGARSQRCWHGMAWHGLGQPQPQQKRSDNPSTCGWHLINHSRAWPASAERDFGGERETAGMEARAEFSLSWCK